MKELNEICAIKIHECYQTNSTPLRVECEDGSQYIAKTVFNMHPPLIDLINEILCNYALQIWKIPVPTQAIISVEKQLIDHFVKEGNSIDRRYEIGDFSSLHFFGTQFIDSVTDMDVYNLNLKNKYDFNKYSNPLDFIKIAVFDKWIGNMDRRKGNPNLLLSASANGFTFIPIDHTQAFAYQGNYKNLKLSIMDRADNNSIMLTPMYKSICNFVEVGDLKNLSSEILSSINDTLIVLDDVFDCVPKNFGLSKSGSRKIKEILSDQERNKAVSNIYLKYYR